MKDFNVHAWDLTQTIVQLHSKYSVDPFFKIDVVPDDRVAGQNIIQVSTAHRCRRSERIHTSAADGPVWSFEKFEEDGVEKSPRFFCSV